MVESGQLKTYSFILKEPGEKRQVMCELYLYITRHVKDENK